MLKPGDKVKYIGMNFPEYTGSLLEVDRVGSIILILLKPEEDRKLVSVEAEPGKYHTWLSEILICDTDEVEVEEV